MKQLIINRIKCKKCEDIVISHHRHDFRYCKCGAVATDGGLDYQIITGKIEDYENLSIYSTADFEEIREHFERGGRGIDGKQPLTWVPLAKMSTDWIKACLVYNKEKGMNKSFASKMYRKELKYRKINKINLESA